MRMWLVNPRLLCRKHLLGEHVEMHMFKSTILLGRNVEGFLNRGLLDIGNIKHRHDELMLELIRRGYKHNSPMKRFNEGEEAKTVNIKNNLLELSHRCKECRKLIINHKRDKSIWSYLTSFIFGDTNLGDVRNLLSRSGYKRGDSSASINRKGGQNGKRRYISINSRFKR